MLVLGVLQCDLRSPLGGMTWPLQFPAKPTARLDPLPPRRLSTGWY